MGQVASVNVGGGSTQAGAAVEAASPKWEKSLSFSNRLKGICLDRTNPVASVLFSSTSNSERCARASLKPS